MTAVRIYCNSQNKDRTQKLQYCIWKHDLYTACLNRDMIEKAMKKTFQKVIAFDNH